MFGPGELYGSNKQGVNYPPCMNPECKSYGKSHPNCRCWGSIGYEKLAEGGDIGTFCAHGIPHMPECEHYKGSTFADSVMAKRKAGK